MGLGGSGGCLWSTAVAVYSEYSQSVQVLLPEAGPQVRVRTDPSGADTLHVAEILPIVSI